MSRQSFNFPADEILSVMTGRQLCENRDGVIFLMEFLVGCELPNGEHSAALPKVAALIADQLEWVRGAEDSFSNFHGKPQDWLKIQIAEHGDSHRLLGPHESETSEGTDSIDPLPSVNEMDSVKEMTMEERHKPYVDAAKKCQLDWSDVNDINSEAVEAVGTLMRLSVGGDESAIEMLRDLAVGITRHLHKHHRDSMEHAQEFPVVLPAGNEQRQQKLDEYKALPIGKLVGFPHRPGKKTGSSHDESPAGFWREIQWWIDAVRSLAQQLPNNQSAILTGKEDTYKASIQLQQKIAALPDFGSGDREAWFSVARELVDENSDGMTPQWIWDRSLAGKGQRGLPSVLDEELRKGLNYCWSRS